MKTIRCPECGGYFPLLLIGKEEKVVISKQILQSLHSQVEQTPNLIRLGQRAVVRDLRTALQKGLSIEDALAQAEKEIDEEVTL
jgi:hypothetical protein